MYETFMHTLRAFLGSGPMEVALLITVPLVVAVIMAWAVPAFRDLFHSLRERGGSRSTLAGLFAGGFKLALLFVLARLIIVAMTFQAQEFEHRHGRITETNRSAVMMKWGTPHEQRTLAVGFSEKRTWVTRKLKLPGEKGQVIDQTYWADEEQDIEPVDGQKPPVLSVKKEERRLPVIQQAIESADVKIRIENNPRTLGNANYAGFNDRWEFRYVVVNNHSKPVTARMTFPLPTATGVFDQMVLKIDGVNKLSGAKTGQVAEPVPVPAAAEEGDSDNSNGNGDVGESRPSSALTWDLPMAPGQRSTIELAYNSRGLEHLRYIPARMTQTGHYQVTAHVVGIPARDLNWPIGSMPPRENLADITGEDYDLSWNLDNAMTSYDIGVLLPVAKQPNYYFASLLQEAPIGLLLLLAALVLPRLIAGRAVGLAVIGLLAAAYYLFYTFMGNLADLVDGRFIAAFAISIAIVGGMVLVFRLADKGRSPGQFLQDVAAFFAAVVLYPLAVIDTRRTAFWMQLFYLGLFLYVCALVVRHHVAPAVRRKAAAG